MKKSILFGMLVLVVAMAQGCIVPSVHPLYGSTEETIYDPALAGRWLAGEGEVWEFAEKQEKDNAVSHYLLTVTDDNEPVGILQARLVEIGSHRFLDVIPYDFEYSVTTSSVQDAMESVAAPYPHGFEFSSTNESDNTPGLWINNSLLFPTHTFLQIRVSGDDLELAFIDYEWVTESAEKGYLDIAHETTDGLVLITASTEELQGFMLKYAGDAEVFPFEKLRREK